MSPPLKMSKDCSSLDVHLDYFVILLIGILMDLDVKKTKSRRKSFVVCYRLIYCKIIFLIHYEFLFIMV